MKITKVPCTSKVNASLVLIPGGPGLSSLTLRSLDILCRSFDLYYVDFPGTNGLPFDHKRSFESLSQMLFDEIEMISGPVISVGHSFGGFFAARAAIDLGLAGLVSLSAPFSAATLKSASENYTNLENADLKAAREVWGQSPSKETFNRWLSLYGELYFAPKDIHSGRELLENDPSSFEFFLANRSDTSQFEEVLWELSGWAGKKLFMGGMVDRMVNVDLLSADALKAKAVFQPIPDASHFLSFDQPEVVAKLIEYYFATKSEE
jgi:pimeloyl-ACP methyl ester carboxylesterase